MPLVTEKIKEKANGKKKKKKEEKEKETTTQLTIFTSSPRDKRKHTHANGNERKSETGAFATFILGIHAHSTPAARVCQCQWKGGREGGRSREFSVSE